MNENKWRIEIYQKKRQINRLSGQDHGKEPNECCVTRMFEKQLLSIKIISIWYFYMLEETTGQ